MVNSIVVNWRVFYSFYLKQSGGGETFGNVSSKLILETWHLIKSIHFLKIILKYLYEFSRHKYYEINVAIWLLFEYVAILAICTFYLLNLKNHFNSHYFKKVAKIANMK